jgi:hypothetical protein
MDIPVILKLLNFKLKVIPKFGGIKAMKYFNKTKQTHGNNNDGQAGRKLHLGHVLR